MVVVWNVWSLVKLHETCQYYIINNSTILCVCLYLTNSFNGHAKKGPINLNFWAYSSHVLTRHVLCQYLLVVIKGVPLPTLMHACPFVSMFTFCKQDWSPTTEKFELKFERFLTLGWLNINMLPRGQCCLRDRPNCLKDILPTRGFYCILKVKISSLHPSSTSSPSQSERV